MGPLYMYIGEYQKEDVMAYKYKAFGVNTFWEAVKCVWSLIMLPWRVYRFKGDKI